MRFAVFVATAMRDGWSTLKGWGQALIGLVAIYAAVGLTVPALRVSLGPTWVKVLTLAVLAFICLAVGSWNKCNRLRAELADVAAVDSSSRTQTVINNQAGGTINVLVGSANDVTGASLDPPQQGPGRPDDGPQPAP